MLMQALTDLTLCHQLPQPFLISEAKLQVAQTTKTKNAAKIFVIVTAEVCRRRPPRRMLFSGGHCRRTTTVTRYTGHSQGEPDCCSKLHSSHRGDVGSLERSIALNLFVVPVAKGHTVVVQCGLQQQQHLEINSYLHRWRYSLLEFRGLLVVPKTGYYERIRETFRLLGFAVDLDSPTFDITTSSAIPILLAKAHTTHHPAPCKAIIIPNRRNVL